ncbi:MAG: FAD-dependent monooxygenase [Burkholderiales bacterium]|nr:FAD-dependent monooxygenase [Burkholderiales bacterium]
MSSMKFLVVGGGPVGLAAALALKARGITDDITVLEAAPREQRVFSDRNIALSAASWRFLTRLNVTVPPTERAPIVDVEVSQRGAFGLLRLTADDVGATELGAATPYPSIKTALDNAIHAANIHILYGAKAQRVEHVARHAVVRLESGEQLRADCVVLADGAGSDLVNDFKRLERDSGQMAVITRVSPTKPRPGVAFERFTAGGALALVPRADKEWTVIWARPRVEAERLLQLDQTTLRDEINAAFGPNMGALTITATATSYPLVWRFVEPRASGAIVALGNAAQGLHPAAAQGLNLGLRDAQDLAELFSHAGDCNTDSIAPTLAKFARKRGPDRVARIGFTGMLAYGFDRGGWLFDVPRGLGLTAVQMLPPLRRELVRHLALS